MKVFRFACAAALAAILVGCGGGSPDSVAVDFLSNVRDGKFDAAAKCASKKAAPLISMMSAMGSLGGSNDVLKEMKGTTFKVLETKVDGDKATVKIEAFKNGKSEKAEDIQLVKEDGAWKVDINKK